MELYRRYLNSMDDGAIDCSKLDKFRPLIRGLACLSDSKQGIRINTRLESRRLILVVSCSISWHLGMSSPLNQEDRMMVMKTSDHPLD